MAAQDTFSTQTLITKTPVNGHAVSSGDQTGFGARARARHASREEGKDKIVCCVGRIRMAWLGHLFLGFPAITKSRKKGGSIFRKAYPPPPTPTSLSTSLHFPTRPSCAQHLATACLFRLLGTNIKCKDGATQVLSSMFLYFPTSRFVAIIFML